MKILVTGQVGQVAWELRRTLACLGEVVALELGSAPLSLDLADAGSIRQVVQTVKPGLIVNAAAYTAVDKAEQDQAIAYAVNATALGFLAEEANKIGAGIIHYSTDYVFPGDASVPYRETDDTGPNSVYGASKLAGEQAIIDSGIPHYILRTAWVYGNRGGNFLLTMLRLMRERELVRVVNDQLGSPTWSRMIAEATALIIAQSLENGRFVPGDRSGIYHLTNGGQTSWFGFAQAIREEGIASGLLPETCARIEGIPSSEYPTPAKRPAYSVLNNTKLDEVFNLRLPEWREALGLCVAK
ncbi:MAG: dTDP-4-dehydrorhamnose reductase [Proteobacteria bacterium]|nr:dTDP-4-dehydrorhamnose reductase [Pseudomonadota bacterium]